MGLALFLFSFFLILFSFINHFSHVGWSTVHIGVAGVLLDVVEPQLIHDPRVLLQIIASIRLSNVSHNLEK